MTLTPESTQMFAEAGEAAEVAARSLADNAAVIARLATRFRSEPPRMVVTCARGSSDHAGTYARYLIETRTGVLTSSLGLSVSSLYEASPSFKGALLLAISQSGKSPDLLAAVEAARKAGAFVVALVNVEESPLAKTADEVIALRAGPEKSVAATKSFLATLAASAHLVSEWIGDAALVRARAELSESLSRAWGLDWSAGAGRLRRATNLYVVGRGLGLGIAQEAALKLKETSGLHAEAFSAAEIMHGPLALAKPGFPALFLAQNDETKASVDAAAEAFAARGAEVMRTGGDLPTLSAHPAIEPILMAQSFYRMANTLSVQRGYDPDKPPHLKKVTETV